MFPKPILSSMPKARYPRNFENENKVGDTYVLLFRVTSSHELEERKDNIAALIGLPADGEGPLHTITDTEEKMRAHAVILVDVAGKCNLDPDTGTMFDLYVDEEGKVDIETFYYSTDQEDSALLDYAYTGPITREPADTCPKSFGLRLAVPCDNVLTTMTDLHGEHWSSKVNCQTFAYEVVSSFFGPDHWPEYFMMKPGDYVPWMVKDKSYVL